MLLLFYSVLLYSVRSMNPPQVQLIHWVVEEVTLLFSFWTRWTVLHYKHGYGYGSFIPTLLQQQKKQKEKKKQWLSCTA